MPFQVPTSICPLRLVPSFNLHGYGRLLLHVTKPYLRVNFLDQHFSLHKINSEEFNISGQTLVRPKGD